MAIALHGPETAVNRVIAPPGRALLDNNTDNASASRKGHTKFDLQDVAARILPDERVSFCRDQVRVISPSLGKRMTD